LNTLKYVSVYGSSASTTDGVIKFATSTSGNGNDNNLIDNCAVTNSSGNRPECNLPLGRQRLIIVRIISNNAIYDLSIVVHLQTVFIWGEPLGQSQPIVLRDNQFAPLAGTLVYTAISIDNAAGNNFTVSNNHIGGKAALNAGCMDS
jgi:hypothetical protein